MPYLVKWTQRLQTGALAIDPPRRQRHAAFLQSLQNADGGFPGRQGPSDPYYTSFALRALALAGGLAGPAAHRAADYLRRQAGRPLALVDQASVVFGASILEALAGAVVFSSAEEGRRWLREGLAAYRCAGGGYAKAAGSQTKSTYATFLAVMAMQLMGLPLAEPEHLAALVRSCQRADGGFVELEAMRHGGTNPTAAAVALLRVFDALDTAVAEQAAQFLLAMQNAEGGFCAHGRIPMADLLSTFTALAALADLGALERVDAGAVRRYIARCENPKGGFGSGWGEPVPDAEYTFYGLAAEALLLAAGR